MIIRIVRMHFTEAGVKEFLPIFESNKEAIRHFPGCIHLQLLKDVHSPLTYTTMSHWEQADNLEHYRQSALFQQVWARVKPLFADRPQAFSLEKFIEV
ncbi:MAG: antibiotic biosynthesis monooxygenase [Azospira oryzae]|nr:MAG: antibiotic biosynthesis monooxygenase [Azospira oryzae]